MTSNFHNDVVFSGLKQSKVIYGKELNSSEMQSRDFFLYINIYIYSYYKDIS